MGSPPLGKKTAQDLHSHLNDTFKDQTHLVAVLSTVNHVITKPYRPEQKRALSHCLQLLVLMLQLDQRLDESNLLTLILDNIEFAKLMRWGLGVAIIESKDSE